MLKINLKKGKMKKLILRKILDSQGRSLRWLAGKMDVSHQTILNWCHGHTKPTYDKVFQIAEVLGIQAGDLYE